MPLTLGSAPGRCRARGARVTSPGRGRPRWHRCAARSRRTCSSSRRSRCRHGCSPPSRGCPAWSRPSRSRRSGCGSTAPTPRSLGVDPSVFRSFAARPTGASERPVAGRGRRRHRRLLHDGQAGQDHARRLGARGGPDDREAAARGGVRHAGHRRRQRGGVRRDRPLARRAGRQRDRGQRATGDFTADAAAVGRLLPKGAGVEQLVSLVSSAAARHRHGAGPGRRRPRRPAAALDTMLSAAMSRRGLPYVWGAAGPASFDCSGLVQWSFAQAGIVMPRVAADQALAGPAVPVSQLQPGDLLFYHTDPTEPGYISHVAIYLGNGWMIQAPEPGHGRRGRARPTSAPSSPARSGSTRPRPPRSPPASRSRDFRAPVKRRLPAVVDRLVIASVIMIT